MIGSTEKFLNTVADLVRQGKLPAVVDIADRGDKDGECLAIDVKKGTTDEEIDKILNLLYKKAGLEENYSVNMNCIYNKKPEVMGLRRILETYTGYKWEVYTAKYERLLADQKDVREVKEGLLEAVDVIDLIIEILRGSSTTKEAKECLMYGKTDNIKFRYKGSIADAKELHFTEKQTDAILAMRLQKLIGLEVDILKKELAEAEKKIAKYEKLLKSKAAMKKQMISDIEELKKNYGAPRKSVIENIGEVVVEKEKVVATEETILLDRFFYIKSAPRAIFEKNPDVVRKFDLNVMSTDRIAIFDSEGMVHIIKVSDILKKQTKKDKKFRITDKGIQIFEFCGMSHTADVVAMLNVSEMNPAGNLDSDTAKAVLEEAKVKEPYTVLEDGSIEGYENRNLVMVTVEGKAKRVSADLFDTSRKTSQAMKTVVAETNNGYSIKVRSDELPVQGKGAGGVALISLRRGDYVVSAVSGGNDIEFNGKPLSDMKAVKRGGKGNKK